MLKIKEPARNYIVLAAILVLTIPLWSSADSPGLAHPQAGMYEADDYTDPEICGMCHKYQYEQWSGSMHNLATIDPFYHRVVTEAEADIEGISMFCESCHSPISIMTGQDPLDHDNLTPTARAGISCDFCHTVTMATGTGNFSFTSEPGSTKRGPFGSDPLVYHTVEKSELHDSAEFCGTCHNVSHPLNNLPLETTYDEFLNGPYPAEGYKCQSCHMSLGITEFEPNPGPILPGREEREHIWTHYFVGGNAFVTEMEGSDVHAERARDRLSRAADVHLSNAFQFPDSDIFSFTVIVENIGAGHMIPTGVTEERQIWLEVIVYGEDGAKLGHFGELDEAGVINDDTMILGTVFGDADGNPTHKIWFAESVLFDRRIAPRDADMEAYEVSLAAGERVARIEAKLWYRSSHQDFVDVIFSDAEERVIVPSILMAEVEQDF